MELRDAQAWRRDRDLLPCPYGSILCDDADHNEPAIERSRASRRANEKAPDVDALRVAPRAERDEVRLLELVGDFYDAIDLIDSPEQLSAHLETICGLAGIRYFAITHHIDFARTRPGGIHLHNYPVHFANYHDKQGLGLRDPVHRASQLRGAGFFWDKLPGMITLNAEDQDVLDRAERAGVGPGYTVPVHVPGEVSGSCSFAMSRGLTFPRRSVPIVQAAWRFRV